MNQSKCAAAAAMAIVGGYSAASAQDVFIENRGFEDVVFEDDEFLVGPEGGAPGWDGPVLNGATWGGWNPPIDAYPDEAPRGDNVGWIYVVPDALDEPVAIHQDLDATLRSGATYTLTVAVGNPQEYYSQRNDEHFFFEGFPGYRIELLAGDTVIASDENSRTPAEGTFERTSICFAAQDDSPLDGFPLSVRLVNLNDGPGLEVDFDDVRLTASPALCPADLDGDGDVDADDFFIYLDLFAQGC